MFIFVQVWVKELSKWDNNGKKYLSGVDMNADADLSWTVRFLPRHDTWLGTFQWKLCASKIYIHMHHSMPDACQASISLGLLRNITVMPSHSLRFHGISLIKCSVIHVCLLKALLFSSWPRREWPVLGHGRFLGSFTVIVKNILYSREQNPLCRNSLSFFSCSQPLSLLASHALNSLKI